MAILLDGGDGFAAYAVVWAKDELGDLHIRVIEKTPWAPFTVTRLVGSPDIPEESSSLYDDARNAITAVHRSWESQLLDQLHPRTLSP